MPGANATVGKATGTAGSLLETYLHLTLATTMETVFYIFPPHSELEPRTLRVEHLIDEIVER